MENVNYGKKALRGISIVFITSILAAFFGYLIRITLARNLTVSDYGLFFACLTLINLIALFKDFGLGQSLIKFVPEFQVKKKLDLIKSSILTVFFINLFTAIIIGAILFLLSDIIAIHYLKNPSASIVMKLFSIVFISFFFKDFTKVLFQSFQKFTSFSFIYLTENLLIFSLIILFLNSKTFSLMPVISPVIVYLIVPIVLFIIYIPLFLKSFNLFKYKNKFSKVLTTNLLSFGLPIMLYSLGSMIIVYTDTLILTLFVPLSEVGIYNAVVPTVMLLSFFGTSIAKVMFPMLSELNAKKLNDSIRNGMEKLLKYLLIILIPISLSILMFSNLILRVLFGSEYISGSNTMKLLVFAVTFLVLGVVNLNILSALNYPKKSAKIMLVGAIINLILNFAIIPFYGIFGAALTSLISYLIIFLWSLIELKKLVNIKIPILSWIKTIFCGSLFVLCIYLLNYFSGRFIEIDTIIASIIIFIISLLFYFILMLTIKEIDMKEIKRLILRDK